LPNPYLEDLPEHKIVSTSGQKLTLVNPEYMIRQVYEMQKKQHGTLGHITSLDPIRPENEANLWETEALEAFEGGALEATTVTMINKKPYLRLMRPMITERGCLKCHAPQGYMIGDIRGGVSVSIPLTPLLEISEKNIFTYSIVHAILWLFGLSGILYGSLSVSRSIRDVEQAEARTRLVIENMLDGVITLDEQGHIESLNSSASQMFGYTPDEVVGLKMAKLLEGSSEKGAVLSSDAQWGEDALAHSLAHASPRELTGKRKDDTTFPLEVSVSEMLLGAKRVFIVMVRDNTDRKEAEKALLESQKQIIKQEKLVSLGTMVAGIAHEINNPAQAIGFSMEGLKLNLDYVEEMLGDLDAFLEVDESELVVKRAEFKTKVKALRMDLVVKCVKDISDRNINSIERIDHIINSTKRMANSEEEFKPCDINTIINDAVTLTRNQIKYITKLDVDLSPDLPKINGLVQELGQVFINLIINARDAISDRGLSMKEAQIWISSEYNQKQKSVIVRFEDNGSGIPKDIVDKIFDPFFTTKGIGEGMGLGLNLCHRIIEAHGGEITVDSTPGEGTCFTIKLDICTDC
jgi:PAS domain S-box-containing protein